MPAAWIVRFRPQRRLHFVEVGQHMLEVPVGHPWELAPFFIIHRVSALENHAIDGAGTTKNLAACVVDAAAIHLWLRLGLVFPIVKFVSNREGERGGHVDE